MAKKNVEDIEEEKIKDIEDLPGVGPKTIDKLREAGFNDLMSIAVSSPATLADIADMTKATALKAINAARSVLKFGFKTGIVIGS